MSKRIRLGNFTGTGDAPQTSSTTSSPVGQIASQGGTAGLYNPSVTIVEQLASAPDAGSRKKGAYASPINVARYLVQLASLEDESDFLSHLRLQKLMYYVQGWSLAIRKKPMFIGRIEAWAHGPVVKELYAKLARSGNKPVLPEEIGPPRDLTPEECRFIESVWASYKQFSASSLREMTHKETPWKHAREGIGPVDRCEKEITNKDLQNFFSKLATK